MNRPALALNIGVAVILVAAFFAVLQTVPARGAERCQIVGDASWYGHQFHGRTTRSGERFNQWAMTAAMPSKLNIGEYWRVTYRGKSVVVRINDTGAFAKYGRVIDLSRGAFGKLAPEGQGVIKRVCLERL